MVDPRGGDHRAQARYFAPLAVLDSETLTERQEELARAVLEAMLLAGLPAYNAEAAADGEETGVGLTPAPGSSCALRVVWQQDATATAHLPTDLCHAQQAAMHQALRTILAAHRFWIEDGPLGAAPIVRGITRPGRGARPRPE
ncbi:hypothetical protein Q3V23_00040 [Streptomyces sp. VNUA116]|uniref:hypothetical protein n=1 Tax=Streptomyces sp. VNUA116 TaxID=3062449 RepID=UPI002675A2F5|nr:hypothetical protein [Streptomyces sp. VNUA116]WKU42592.1 hypothetical protein Q3V23_00040 [Streptomyces sp. VNUA116]